MNRKTTTDKIKASNIPCHLHLPRVEFHCYYHTPPCIPFSLLILQLSDYCYCTVKVHKCYDLTFSFSFHEYMFYNAQQAAHRLLFDIRPTYSCF